MAGRTRAQDEMIDVINSVNRDWPVTLLYLTPNGANMKIQAGRSDNRREEQLTLAAMYMLFLEEHLEGDLHEVAEEAAAVAEEMRGDDSTGELHRGGSLEDS